MPPTRAPTLAFLDEAGFQRREINVEHHHDKEEKHRDRADVDDDQQHCQELGTEQNKESGRIEERQDQEQHGMHGILREHDHRARSDREHGK